jgi:hypothetical protein
MASIIRYRPAPGQNEFAIEAVRPRDESGQPLPAKTVTDSYNRMRRRGSIGGSVHPIRLRKQKVQHFFLKETMSLLAASGWPICRVG